MSGCVHPSAALDCFTPLEFQLLVSPPSVDARVKLNTTAKEPEFSLSFVVHVSNRGSAACRVSGYFGEPIPSDTLQPTTLDSAPPQTYPGTEVILDTVLPASSPDADISDRLESPSFAVRGPFSRELTLVACDDALVQAEGWAVEEWHDEAGLCPPLVGIEVVQ